MPNKATSSEPPQWLVMRKKITVREAAELNAVSEDTFRRNFPHLIKQVSPKRGAVTLADALNVGEAKKVRAT